MSAVSSSASFVPVIDIGALFSPSSTSAERQVIVQEIGDACRYVGFFYIINHGVSLELQDTLESLSREFFARATDEEKESVSMNKGGKAWRGYFPVGAEFTSGKPDQKEGVYFGTHLDVNEHKDEENPALKERAERLLHGKNLYPSFTQGDNKVSLQGPVDAYMKEMKRVGTELMKAMVLSLNIKSASPGAGSGSHSNIDTRQISIDDFNFADPVELFRIFNYPPHDDTKYGEGTMGVGTHTDYGFITILKQDNCGGLQIQKLTEVTGKSDGGKEAVKILTTWIDVPPIPNSFVINLGDCLERCTGGLYKATPHRVVPRVGAKTSRLSFPYFFDPDWTSTLLSVEQLIKDQSKEDAALIQCNRRLVGERWDKNDPLLFTGTYGDYLLMKVEKVFPDLAAKQLEAFRTRVAAAATFSTKQIAQMIDHTLLAPDATAADIQRICSEAKIHQFFSVCVPPCWVPFARSCLKDSTVKVVTVISFPHGNDLSASKGAAAEGAVRAGADEIDMVVNQGWVQTGDWTAVEEDIATVVKAVSAIPVKVILETCNLSKEQIKQACACCVRAGAAFVKTSTGFSKGGASVAAVESMRAAVPPTVQVKASGGIRDRETALAMIRAGATRLGTSSGVAIVTGGTTKAAY